MTTTTREVSVVAEKTEWTPRAVTLDEYVFARDWLGLRTDTGIARHLGMAPDTVAKYRRWADAHPGVVYAVYENGEPA